MSKFFDRLGSKEVKFNLEIILYNLKVNLKGNGI